VLNKPTIDKKTKPLRKGQLIISIPTRNQESTNKTNKMKKKVLGSGVVCEKRWEPLWWIL